MVPRSGPFTSIPGSFPSPLYLDKEDSPGIMLSSIGILIPNLEANVFFNLGSGGTGGLGSSSIQAGLLCGSLEVLLGG